LFECRILGPNLWDPRAKSATGTAEHLGAKDTPEKAGILAVVAEPDKADVFGTIVESEDARRFKAKKGPSKAGQTVLG